VRKRWRYDMRRVCAFMRSTGAMHDRRQPCLASAARAQGLFAPSEGLRRSKKRQGPSRCLFC
jgi:hypothetical protein